MGSYYYLEPLLHAHQSNCGIEIMRREGYACLKLLQSSAFAANASKTLPAAKREDR
jgi:hypothetical protein